MRGLRIAARWLLGAFFVLAGTVHLVRPEVYLKAMPGYLPAPMELILVSGVFEILGGVGVLIPRVRRAAGWGLAALLVAVFPANVHMAMHPELFPGLAPWALWVRLPFQGLFVAWVWWAALAEEP